MQDKRPPSRIDPIMEAVSQCLSDVCTAPSKYGASPETVKMCLAAAENIKARADGPFVFFLDENEIRETATQALKTAGLEERHCKELVDKMISNRLERGASIEAAFIEENGLRPDGTSIFSAPRQLGAPGLRSNLPMSPQRQELAGRNVHKNNGRD